MTIGVIAAVASNGVIGRGNQLPWPRIPGDLPRFKQLTMGQTLVMGRKTFDSIGRVLPGRTTIVITRNPAWMLEGVQVAASFEAALALAKTSDIFVAGGAEIYALALPIADRLLLTEIDAPFAGDVVFPNWERAAWRCVDEQLQPATPAFPHAFAHRTYARR